MTRNVAQKEYMSRDKTLNFWLGSITSRVPDTVRHCCAAPLSRCALRPGNHHSHAHSVHRLVDSNQPFALSLARPSASLTVPPVADPVLPFSVSHIRLDDPLRFSTVTVFSFLRTLMSPGPFGVGAYPTPE